MRSGDREGFPPEYFSARKIAKLGGRPFSTVRLLRSYRGYLLGLAVFEPVHESHWKIYMSVALLGSYS